jgi:uncharacterized membrane protein required for colicin V production
MNYVDIIIIASTVLCFCLGLITGLVWQLTGIFAMFAGVAATFVWGEQATLAIGRWFTDPAIAMLVAYVGIFTGVGMIVRVLAVVFTKLLEKMKLQKFDRLLGALVGAVKALAVCAVIVVIMSQRGTEDSRADVEKSRLGIHVVALADWVREKMGDVDFKGKAEQFREKLERLRGNSGDTSSIDDETGSDSDTPEEAK